LRIGRNPAAGRPLRPAGPGAGCTNKPNGPERIVRNKPNRPIRAQVGTGRETSLAGPSLALTAPNKTHPTKVWFNRPDLRYRPGNAGRNPARRLLSWASNKPNLPSSETKGKCFGGKELWLIAPTRGLGKTKPISAGWGRILGTRDAGVVQTKPIARSGAPRRCPVGGPGGVTNEVAVRANCAKRTQFGPAWAGHRPAKDAKQTQSGEARLGSGADHAKRTQFASERYEEQVLCEKEVMVNCTYKKPWKNKANLRPPGRREGPGIGCRKYRRHPRGPATAKMVASRPIRGTILGSRVHP
jgi:hypothetical protein